MKLIRYKGPLGSGISLMDGTLCPHGEAVSVSDEMAETLIKERPDVFSLVQTPKKKEGD